MTKTLMFVHHICAHLQYTICTPYAMAPYRNVFGTVREPVLSLGKAPFQRQVDVTLIHLKDVELPVAQH